MKRSVRESENQDVQNGDIVIGCDGKPIMVKHGGTYARVHVFRLRKAPLPMGDGICQAEVIGNNEETSQNNHQNVIVVKT